MRLIRCFTAWCVGSCLSLGALAQPIAVAAHFSQPTQRYPHNIMGALSAHIRLEVQVADCKTCPQHPRALGVTLPDALVFEDFAPRLVDLNGDGVQEILVVESDQHRGARLALWEIDQGQLVRGASTDFIGTRFRWLAPVGVADFEGKGTRWVAYVEKPHLDKVLRLVRRQGDRLVPVDAIHQVTNHVIGQASVQSRIEVCPEGPVMVMLSGDAKRVVAVRWGRPSHSVRDLGPSLDRQLPAQVLACQG